MSRYDDEIPCARGCRGCSYCSDAYGVDAMKDANAEAGRSWDDPQGYSDAKSRGWTRARGSRRTSGNVHTDDGMCFCVRCLG